MTTITKSDHIFWIKTPVLKMIDYQYFIPICFAVAFIIRLAYILLIPTTPDIADSKWYYETAINLASGKGLMYNGKLTAYWPMGYSAFLGALFWMFGPSIFIAKLANVILYMGVLLFSYLLSKKLFSSEFISRTSLFILALYPNHISYSAEIMSETLFLFLFMMGAYFLFKSERIGLNLFISGLVFGFATLVKSQVIFLPGLLLIFWVAINSKNTIKTMLPRIIPLLAMLYFSLSLFVLPLTLRNYLVFDKFVLVSNNGGINLFLGNSPLATRAVYGMPILPNDIQSTYEHDVQVDEYQADKKMSKQIVDYIREHPVETLINLPKKAWYMWYMDVDGGRLNERNSVTATDSLRRFFFIFKLVSQAYYLCIISLFFVAMYFLLQSRHNRDALSLGLLIIVYFTCISLVFHGQTRFHFPVMPWIVIYASFAVEKLLHQTNTVVHTSHSG